MRCRHTVVFPGADLAGEQADAFEFDEVVESGLGLAPGVGFEQLVGLGGGLEGHAGEGAVSQVHQSSSLSFRRLSGEGGGSGAGSAGFDLLGVDAAFDRGIGVGVEAGWRGRRIFHRARRRGAGWEVLRGRSAR